MNPLPLPVRLAAGLVATAVEQVRDLPRLVVELPVTAVSQALQTSMRVQQRITELAIKGDRALGALRPVEEKPSWATFDEDEPHTNGVSTVTELRPAPRRAPQRVAVERPADDAAPVSAGDPAVNRASVDVAAPDAPAADAPAATEPPPADPAQAVERIAAAPVDEPAAEPEESPLPGYGAMSIAQLRGKLRRLSVEELRALLAWEKTHDDRPAYVTMLSNRITTVSEA